MQRWLDIQPREIALTIAARHSLRVLPLIIVYQHDRPARSFFRRKVLPCFRANAVAWAAANFRTHDAQLREAARGAERDAKAAFFAASMSTDAAFAAAYQAAYRTAREGYDPEAIFFRSPPNYGLSNAAYADGYAAAVRASAADADEIEGEDIPAALDLASEPLWPELPAAIRLLWPRLRRTLLEANDSWEVWTEWYDDRLAGRPADPDVELARVTLPQALWELGPTAVNPELLRLIGRPPELFGKAPEQIPPQGAGPHFIIGRDGPITLAPPAEIDAAGNNIRRIRQQLPLVRRAAARLSEHLSPNAFPEISQDLADYRASIADETQIAWGTVFGLGVMLENAAVAAERHLADPMWPRLEDAAKAALDSY
jgi:hypothetical protein